VFVPTWLAVLVAILLIGGIGFGIGFASADNGDSDSHRASSSQQVPSTERPRNNPGNNAPNPGNGAFPNGRDAAQTAFLGVSVESVDNNGGARITNVQSGSPAADAGLKTGDVITKIGDTNVQNAADIFRAVRTHSPGDSVTITYTRDGNSAQAKVQLGRLSDATRSSVPS
jgi:S1-C subfamily serine protease